MSDSFLRYWRILEAIIPIKVDLVEAGLAYGLPRAADHDRHGHGQDSSLGCRDDPQGAPPPTSGSQDIQLQGDYPLRRDDAICHGRKFSIMLTPIHKFVTSTFPVRSITKQANI